MVTNQNTYRIFKGSVVIHANGITVTISTDDERYNRVRKLIRRNNLSDMDGIVNAETLGKLESLLGIELNRGES